MTFDGRFPNKHDLDPISPNHPVMLINQGGHMAVVNSLALEMAGVNASTPDPGNGRFLREANGEPNGTVMNHPAMDYFRKLWPPDLLDLKAMETSILSPQAKFASMGVTSFQDVYARDMDRMQAYFNIAQRGEMTIRGQVMNVLEYIQELDGRIPAIEAMRYEDDYMHFAGAKFQVDGAVEASFTHEPHNGIAWNISDLETGGLEPGREGLPRCGLPGGLPRGRGCGGGHGAGCHRGGHERQSAPRPAAPHRTLRAEYGHGPAAHQGSGRGDLHAAQLDPGVCGRA